jgi:cytosine deaminase
LAIVAIYNAQLLDRAGRWTVRLAAGRVAAVEPFAADRPLADVQSAVATGTGVDAAGGLLAPALVDAHLHLDLAYSLDLVPPNRSGTLLEAIGLWSAAKKELTADNVYSRALRAIGDEVDGGTGFIRSHVDVASSAGLRLAEGVLRAREVTRAL